MTVGSEVDHTTPPRRPLVVCIVGLSLTAIVVAGIARAAWDPWLPVLLVTAPLSVAPLVVAGGTLRRLTRGPDSTGRSPRTRVVVATAVLGAVTAFAIVLTGDAGLLLSFLTAPTMTGLLAVAWVRPSERQAALSFIAGAVLFPVSAWGVGQGDERLSVAIGTTLVVVACLVALWFLRAWATRDYRSRIPGQTSASHA